MTNIKPIEKIERTILYIRSKKVMLDADLADLYGIETKRLNERVKRNIERFPSDFMFQLTKEEKQEVVANCDHLRKIKFSPSNPYAFTEHGAIMLASVLNTQQAVQTSVLIVRAFVRLRELVLNHKDLAQKINELENKYDHQFKVVFEALKQLIKKENKPRKQIGYKQIKN